MNTRILNTKFWADEYISSLSIEGKIIFLYYLLNERVNIIHCYECPDKYVIADTGVIKKNLIKYQEKFARDNKLSFYKGYVKIINAGKYESFKGEKNEKKKNILLTQLSIDVLDWYNNKKNTPIDTPIDTPIMIGSINHKSKTINHKEGGMGETKNYLSIFLEEFNKKFQTKYQETDKRTKLLSIRLERFRLEEVLLALSNMATDTFYQGKNDRNWRADPDYLLRSDEQIDKFINKKPKDKYSIAEYV